MLALPIVDGASIGRPRKQVFAGFQRAVVMEVVPDNARTGIADYPCGLQFKGDSPSGISGPQEHKLLLSRVERHEQSPRKPASDKQNRKRQKCEKPSQLTIV